MPHLHRILKIQSFCRFLKFLPRLQLVHFNHQLFFFCDSDTNLPRLMTKMCPLNFFTHTFPPPHVIPSTFTIDSNPVPSIP